MSESTQDDLDRAWLALPEELRRKIDDESDIYHEASAEQAASRVALWAEKRLAEMTASRDAFRELAYRNREDSAHELARKLDRTEGRLQVKESNLQYYHDYLDGLQRFSREGEKDMSLAGIWIAAEDIEEVLKRWY